MSATKITADEIEYAYWLDNIKRIGSKTLHMLIDRFGSAENVWYADPSVISRLISPAQFQSFMDSKKTHELSGEYSRLKEAGIRFIPRMHPDYPGRLLNIPDPPFALYVKGRMPNPDKPSAAIIGARLCSEYGRYIARQFGLALAAAGIQIISGMAMGIDGISQKAALDSGGDSFAVTGCGPDICYPAENKELYDRLVDKGGIISEYKPHTEPKAHLFPPRNRIISGLADIIIVIEARRHSGTLITVDMALEQGKEVFAVPGRITDRLSDGCNMLIRQGAGIALSPQDVMEYFFGIEDQKDYEQTISVPKIGLSQTGRNIMNILGDNPLSVSEIVDRLLKYDINASLPGITNELMVLCLCGLAEQNGNYYKLGS